MSPIERFADAAIDRSRIAIVVMLLLTVAIGYGAVQVESSSQLDQFQTKSDAREKLEYIESNFTTGEGNTTTAQVIVRDGNVLSKESLLAIMEYERALRENETVNSTLAGENPITGIPNAIATTAIVRERAAELRVRAARLQRAQAALQENRSDLRERQRTLNATVDALRAALKRLQRDPNASVQAAFESVRANTTVELDEEDFATFRRAARTLRSTQNRTRIRQVYRLGTRGVLKDEYAALQERVDALRERGRELQARAAELQAARADLRNGTSPSLSEQIAQLRSMNATEIDRTIGVLFSGTNGGQRLLSLMPTDYRAGATEAKATQLIITQRTTGTTNVQGSAPPAIEDAQLAMREIGESLNALEYRVFGQGILAHEIDASMTDSLLIVGPLALLFVLIALIVAYRDLLDILLGLAGIAAVLAWTFGFMGWTGIDFNQIFVAVPVLLIGLSIDYAIHVFMRHREQRGETAEDSRPAMKVALGGVGLALVWVTATTVIGFLSNLTSPVGPIRDFGVVSAFGIVAALLVFGILVPAVKVELDELLEGWGIDRRKPAFGTGGGRFSRALSVGAVLARKSPYVVLALTLLVTAAGAYGATQVDTSFETKDFLAKDPPDWMEELPEPFEPGEYTIRQNLQYVNENFLREDSQAQILIQGSVTDGDTLKRVQQAAELAAGKPVTQTFQSGAASITGPLRTMRRVAATNETFNATFQRADTNGDGVPDRNLRRVYDALFASAPDEAANVIYRTEGGEYRALRLVISVDGGASPDAITTQMRDVADSLDGSGLRATATGTPIVNKVVQDELLRTVVQSLIITLVTIFLFLMVVYRLTEGSATLGIVTLVPVALVVAWILGTMYALDIPFNVLTGTITSLTVGLGVAYGIHVSERYNLELERNESVWEAMRTTVTGTGGALLGSAATTIGGFGVLAFAILPPLKQFGITILYAFLASVLVLPSLLIVWTKFVQPEASEGMFDDEDEGVFDDEDEEETAVAPSTPADATGEGAVANPNAAPGIRAVRETEYEHARPGQELSVTVSLEAVEGRVVVEEAVAGAIPTIEAVEPEPVDAVARGASVFAIWDLDGEDATLTYSVTIPEDAADDDEVTFEGRAYAAEANHAVEGDDRVTVVTDLFERVLARGVVSEDDLRLAGEQFSKGVLTERQYERIQREWLAGPDTTTTGSDGHPAGDSEPTDPEE